MTDHSDNLFESERKQQQQKINIPFLNLHRSLFV